MKIQKIILGCILIGITSIFALLVNSHFTSKDVTAQEGGFQLGDERGPEGQLPVFTEIFNLLMNENASSSPLSLIDLFEGSDGGVLQAKKIWCNNGTSDGYYSITDCAGVGGGGSGGGYVISDMALNRVKPDRTKNLGANIDILILNGQHKVTGGDAASAGGYIFRNQTDNRVYAALFTGQSAMTLGELSGSDFCCNSGADKLCARISGDEIIVSTGTDVQVATLQIGLDEGGGGGGGGTPSIIGAPQLDTGWVTFYKPLTGQFPLPLHASGLYHIIDFATYDSDNTLSGNVDNYIVDLSYKYTTPGSTLGTLGITHSGHGQNNGLLDLIWRNLTTSDIGVDLMITGGAGGPPTDVRVRIWDTSISGGGGGGADTDWTESSGNVYRSSGNVGVGTASPTKKLDVNGKIRMRTQTSGSDSADTVATKKYVDDSVAAVGGGTDGCVWEYTATPLTIAETIRRKIAACYFSDTGTAPNKKYRLGGMFNKHDGAIRYAYSNALCWRGGDPALQTYTNFYYLSCGRMDSSEQMDSNIRSELGM